jgi:hypothetical protein
LLGWDERIVVEWAVRAGAALVVPSNAEELAAAAFWARPTLLHGSAEELAEWSQLFRAGETGEHGLKSRFRRLRAIIVCGTSSLDRETTSFYTGLGAEVVTLDGIGNQL